MADRIDPFLIGAATAELLNNPDNILQEEDSSIDGTPLHGNGTGDIEGGRPTDQSGLAFTAGVGGNLVIPETSEVSI